PEDYDPESEDNARVVYPIADENQLDIFLIPEGWENYKNYMKNGDLVDIGSYLNETSGKILNKYIPTDVINICKYDGSLGAIPSITPYGDCEFLLVNKELYAAYSYSLDENTLSSMTLDSFAPFLKDLANDIAEGGVIAAEKGIDVSDVIPLYNISSMSLLSLTGYKSVIAAQSAPDVGFDGTKLLPDNILRNADVKATYKIVSEINSACGIMPTTDDNVDFDKNFAAGFMVGNMSIMEKYSDDYYVIRVGAPKVDGNEVFNGLYGIAYCADEYSERCMEIITAMNTDKELRNILAYGVENEHYIVSEDTGRVSVVSDEYVMPIYRTGNAFLLMQNENMTEEELAISANSWKYAVQANSIAKVSPYVMVEMDFKAGESTDEYKAIDECIVELERLYDEVLVWISEYPEALDPTTGEAYTFDAYVNYLISKLNENVYVKSSLSSTEGSLLAQYNAWYKSEYPNE
ncbi:MAG: hypothetical protein IJF55_00850, partial [Clostridia bacterium]|nr:hypothetical protein [Clostridia bacterium]